MDNKKLSDIVNQSGFPLQIGVAQCVEQTTASHGWKVLFTEHSWKHIESGTDGFIDIVLEDEHGTSAMVVECKRVLESSWIFLNPDTSTKTRRHAKAWITSYVSGSTGCFGWADVTLEPSCPESQYCVVFGQDAKSKPMLERVGAELVFATEGFAEEENPYFARLRDGLRLYFSVIVTTARLKLCTFDPGTVSLDDGKIETAKFQDLPHVRFRKQLSTTQRKPDFTAGLNNLVRAKEHTVFVVNAEAFPQFLESFDIDDNVFTRLRGR